MDSDWRTHRTRVVEKGEGIEHLRCRWGVEIVDRQVQAKDAMALKRTVWECRFSQR
jgi:hypothetical protein